MQCDGTTTIEDTGPHDCCGTSDDVSLDSPHYCDGTTATVHLNTYLCSSGQEIEVLEDVNQIRDNDEVKNGLCTYTALWIVGQRRWSEDRIWYRIHDVYSQQWEQVKYNSNEAENGPQQSPWAGAA